MDNPCRYCVAPKRHPGCHDRCPERAEWLEDFELKKECIRIAKEEESAMTDYRQQTWRRIKRRFRT